jgi:hypothetical protein
VLGDIGHAAVVPDLIRLAERRLAHGPFHFEKVSRIAGERVTQPFLVIIADALGRCGRGLSNGQSFAAEAKEMLAKLAETEDHRVCEAALEHLKDYSRCD